SPWRPDTRPPSVAESGRWRCTSVRVAQALHLPSHAPSTIRKVHLLRTRPATRTLVITLDPFRYSTRARKASLRYAGRGRTLFLGTAGVGRTGRWDQPGGFGVNGTLQVKQLPVRRPRTQPGARSKVHNAL